jgi:hypothetical protein
VAFEFLNPKPVPNPPNHPPAFNVFSPHNRKPVCHLNLQPPSSNIHSVRGAVASAYPAGAVAAQRADGALSPAALCLLFDPWRFREHLTETSTLFLTFSHLVPSRPSGVAGPDDPHSTASGFAHPKRVGIPRASEAVPQDQANRFCALLCGQDVDRPSSIATRPQVSIVR